MHLEIQDGKEGSAAGYFSSSFNANICPERSGRGCPITETLSQAGWGSEHLTTVDIPVHCRRIGSDDL